TWIALPNANAPGAIRWDSLVESTPPLDQSPTRAPEELATIIYTSGTTGTPKGVAHAFRGLAHDAKAVSDLLGFQVGQRILSYLPLAHILERAGGEAIALRLASHLFFTEGVETFLQDLARARPIVFISVPRLLIKFQQGVFAKVPKQRLDRLLSVP